MKRTLFLFSAILISSIVFAQAPEAFKYQAVVRDNSGNLITEQAVGFQIDILKGETDGTSVYTETHSATTSKLGLVNLSIGSGTSTDDFSAIYWGDDEYFIQISLDATGGTSYELMGTSQLLSVPYALHSKTADSIIGGVNEVDPVFVESVASSITGTDTTNWNNKLDSFTESQTLSINGDTLSILDGNSVKLPVGVTGNDGSSFIVTFSAGITDAEAALKITNEVGANTKYLWVHNTTQLTTIDLTGLTELVELKVVNNSMLSSISVPDLKNCVDITIAGNQSLASVNISSLIANNEINIGGNDDLNSLDISNLEFTSRIFLSEGNLTSFDLPKLKQGLEIQVRSCASLNSINLDVLESSDRINVQYSGISSLSLPLLNDVSSLELVNCTSLSSLDLGNLETGNQIEISRIAPTALSFPKLKTASSIHIDRCSALASIDIPGVDSVDYFSVGSCPVTSIALSSLKSADDITIAECSSLSTIDLPSVESLNSLYVYSCPSVSISLPNLKSLNNMTLQDCSTLSSVNFENLESVSEQISISNCGLTSISFPKLSSINHFGVSACPSLSSIDALSLSAFAGFDVSYCALTTASVNSLLAHFVSISPSITNAYIGLTENAPPAPPTGQGITDKNTLVANGNDVNTD